MVVEDYFGSTPWEQTFEFNSKDSGDDSGGGLVVGPIVVTNSHCRYKGKWHKGIHTRRLTEFAALFLP